MGDRFVSELSCLFQRYTIASAIESVALKAAFCLTIFVLQKSPNKLHNKTIASHNDRHLSLWLQGAFHDLLCEGEALQSRLPSRSVTSQNSQLASTFANLMMEGKVSRAIHLLSQKSKGGVLSLDSPVNCDDPTSDLVCDVLAKKHPPLSPGSVHPNSILLDHTPPPDHDPHLR